MDATRKSKKKCEALERIKIDGLSIDVMLAEIPTRGQAPLFLPASSRVNIMVTPHEEHDRSDEESSSEENGINFRWHLIDFQASVIDAVSRVSLRLPEGASPGK